MKPNLDPSVAFILSGPADYGLTVRENVGRRSAVSVFRVGVPAFGRPDATALALREHLSDSGFKPPYILAAHSFGGFTALAYYEQFPAEVAGIVLIDSTHPLQTPAALEILPHDDEPTSQPIEEFRAFILGFGTVYSESCAQIAKITDLGDLPLIVLAAGNPAMPASIAAPLRGDLTRCWHHLQRSYSRLSRQGELRIVPGAGHDLMDAAPADVIRAIDDLLLRNSEAIGGNSGTL